MLTQSEDVVKHMTLDADKPIDTIFNNIEEFGDISASDINPYTNNNYINLYYNIIQKQFLCKIGLQEWNQKYTADENWAAFKPHFCIAHQELKYFAYEKVVDAGSQSAHFVAKVVQGIANFLQKTDDDSEETLLQISNETSQSTQILPQMVQKTKQMKTPMIQIQIQLNNNNNSGENDNSNGGGKTVPFWRKFYCCTCVAYNHKCIHCCYTTEGHKDTVTLDQHLNRNDCNCHHFEREKKRLAVCNE